jgi:hypothetical protein
MRQMNSDQSDTLPIQTSLKRVGRCLTLSLSMIKRLLLANSSIPAKGAPQAASRRFLCVSASLRLCVSASLRLCVSASRLQVPRSDPPVPPPFTRSRLAGCLAERLRRSRRAWGVRTGPPAEEVAAVAVAVEEEEEQAVAGAMTAEAAPVPTSAIRATTTASRRAWTRYW